MTSVLNLMVISVKAIHLYSKCVIHRVAAHYCSTQRLLLDIPELFQERETQPVVFCSTNLLPLYYPLYYPACGFSVVSLWFFSSPVLHLSCSSHEVLDRYVKLQESDCCHLPMDSASQGHGTGQETAKVHPLGRLAEEIHSTAWAWPKWCCLKPVRAPVMGQALICPCQNIGVSRRQCCGVQAWRWQWMKIFS